MEESLADARIAAAEADIKAGRVTRGTADDAHHTYLPQLDHFRRVSETTV